MKNLITLLLIFLSLTAIAQDKIIKKTGDIINCEVTEIGLDEIKYFYADKPKVSFSIDKGLVTKIIFGSGEEMKIESNNLKNPEFYADQSKHAVKLNFLSPLSGSTEIVYEKNIKPGKSWETSLGIIGLGFDLNETKPRGLYGKFAYKFMRTPDFYMNRMRYAHILKGSYIAPEIAVRYFSYDDYEYNYLFFRSDSKTRKEDFGFAVTLKLGKQWVFDDSFLVDWFFGIGYGISSANEALNHGFIAGPSEAPFAFTSGLRVGWVF